MNVPWWMVPVSHTPAFYLVYSPFHEISASWRKCILLPSAVKHSIQHGGIAWSRIRVALIWGSAQNIFLGISVITVVLSIQRSYITDGNHTFIIPDYFSYQMRMSGWYFKASSFLVSLLYPMATGWLMVVIVPHEETLQNNFVMLWYWRPKPLSTLVRVMACCLSLVSPQ